MNKLPDELIEHIYEYIDDFKETKERVILELRSMIIKSNTMRSNEEKQSIMPSSIIGRYSISFS